MIVTVSPPIVAMQYTTLMVVAKIDTGTAAAQDVVYETTVSLRRPPIDKRR